MAKEKPLAGHIAFVTGANRPGIGRAIARRLSAEGAKIVLHSSGKAGVQDLDETRDLIAGAGGEVSCLTCDLTDGEARADLVARASAFYGDIDILINNAGRNTAWAPPSKIDRPARIAMFEINCHAPIDLVQQALPAMKAKGWGRIVNISSNSVSQPGMPYISPPKFIHAMTAYGSSKIALERITLGLADQLMGSGVTINSTKPYAVAWTEGAGDLTRQMYDDHPDLIEPLEVLAEATFLLVTRGDNGSLLDSRQVLQRHEAPLHALDGETVIGDAASLVPREQVFSEAS